MSEHGHAGATEAHGDHHYEYLGEATNEAAPDEPITPGWLTLLGITLVLAAMLAYVATRPDGKTRAELSPPVPSGAVEPAAAAPANSALRPSVRPLASGFRGLPPGMVPSAFAARPGASGMPPRPLRPPGSFAIQPGTPPGGPGGAPPPQRRPAPPGTPQ